MNTSRAKLACRGVARFAASEDWWSRTVTLRLLRVAGAACFYYHYNPKIGHDGGTCTRDPQLCRLVPSLLGHVVVGKETAVQVTRPGKTSPRSVLNDRGLIGGAGGIRTRTLRIKSPLC